MSKPMRELCEATADGLNYYLARHPEIKPRLITRFEPWHALAFGRFAQYQLFIYRRAVRENEIRGAVVDEGAPRKKARLSNGSGGKSGKGKDLLPVNLLSSLGIPLLPKTNAQTTRRVRLGVSLI
jgi:hypothetical protein